MSLPRQLVIDRVPADFHPDTHVALGPWCFAGTEDMFPDWDTLSFIDPFEIAADRWTAAEACQALANELLDELWLEMNRKHGTAHDRRYWHAVLMPWILHLIMFSWRIYARVTAFVTMAGEESFRVGLVRLEGRIGFSGTRAFITACCQPCLFRTWLIGETVRRLAPSHWLLETVGTIAIPPVMADTSPPYTWRPVMNVHSMGRLEEVLIGLFVNLIPLRSNPPPLSLSPKISYLKDYFTNLFIDFSRMLMELTMPETFRSGFMALDANAGTTKYRYGRLHVTSIDWADDQNNFMLGHAIEAGERVVVVQHGGGYGWCNPVPDAAEFYYLHDHFITWGWTKQPSCRGRFRPLPSIMLSHNRNNHRPSNDEIIFVGTGMMPLQLRIDYSPSMIEYRRWKRRFMTALSPTVISKMRYRPYHVDYGIEDATWVRRFFPNIPIVDGVLQPVLFKSRLVVVDHPITTMAIALSANIPTIGFWQKDAWPLALEAESFFADLERVGIVFDNPEAAATKITEIWPRLESWWQEPERQQVRMAWCRRFAWADRWWWLRWLTALAEL